MFGLFFDTNKFPSESLSPFIPKLTDPLYPIYMAVLFVPLAYTSPEYIFVIPDLEYIAVLFGISEVVIIPPYIFVIEFALSISRALPFRPYELIVPSFIVNSELLSIPL